MSWTLQSLLQSYVFIAGVVMMLALMSVLVARDVLNVRLDSPATPSAKRARLAALHARVGRSIIPCAVGFAVTAVARVVQVLVNAL